MVKKIFDLKREYLKQTHLKNEIENFSTREDAFYQSEWVEMNSNWVIFISSF